MRRSQIIYFEASTGTIRTSPPADSNLRQYRVLEKRRAEIKKALADAIPDSGGLLYKLKFIRDLVRWEKEALQIRPRG